MVSLQIDFRRPRESINQVRYFIESAIYYGTLFDEQSLRVIHGILPSLCKLVFGSDCPGTSRFDYEKGHPIIEFLSPTGPLMTFLLAHFSNRQWVYTILEEHLPVSTSEALKSGEISDLPDMYQGRVVDAFSLSPAHSNTSLASSLSFNSSSTPSLFNSSLFLNASMAANPNDRFTVTLNMFEYYFFYFSYTLTHPPLPYPTHRSNWYLPLLRAYLDFFIPPPSSPLSTSSSLNPPPQDPVLSTPTKSSAYNNSINPSTSSSSSSSFIHFFNTKHLPQGTVLTPLDRLTCSKFFLGCLIENWFSPTSYKEGPSSTSGYLPFSSSVMESTYAPLSIEALQSVCALTEHISSCELLNIIDIPLMNQEFRLTSYSNNLSSEKLTEIMLKYSYQKLLSKLVPFFKSVIRHHPLDPSFFLLIQAWLLWLTPHRRCTAFPSSITTPTTTPSSPSSLNLHLSKGLAHFVHANLALYIDVWYLCLEKISGLDLMDPKSVHLLHHIVELYSDPRIHGNLSNEVRSFFRFKQGGMYIDFLGYMPAGMIEHVQTVLQKLQLAQQSELAQKLATLFDFSVHLFPSSTSKSPTSQFPPSSVSSSTSLSSTSPPFSGSTSALLLPPVSVYDVDLTPTQALSVTGRYQLKHGLRKSPHFPRLYPGFQRDVIFSTEISWLVPFTYSVSDFIERRFHWNINLRWLAEKNMVCWLCFLLNIYIGFHWKLVFVSALFMVGVHYF